MDLSNNFSVWNHLTPAQQELISTHLICRDVKKGTVLYNGSSDCLGLVLIKKGQLRVYMISEEGREVTLYRLLERDICLFSASCIMKNIQFDITIEAEKDSNICIIPAVIYKRLMEESAAVSNYTNEIMAARFSEVMWLIEQIMWKTFDRRLASFLLEEMALEGSSGLKITHETIAGHLGTAREVVTRMLRSGDELTDQIIHTISACRLNDIWKADFPTHKGTFFFQCLTEPYPSTVATPLLPVSCRFHLYDPMPGNTSIPPADAVPEVFHYNFP